MRRVLFTFLAVAVATITGPAPADAAKQLWFGCLPGYQLETSGTRYARCAKPIRVLKRKPGCVGVRIPGFTAGATLKVNATGKADRCVIANTTAKAPPLCQPGFQLRIRSGPDECVRNVREAPKPVAGPVMR